MRHRDTAALISAAAELDLAYTPAQELKSRRG
jgi:hypothetical protein